MSKTCARRHHEVTLDDDEFARRITAAFVGSLHSASVRYRRQLVARMVGDGLVDSE